MNEFFEFPADWREQLRDVSDVAGQVHLIESWRTKSRIPLLRRAAEGRREYAAGLGEDETNPALAEQRVALLAQAAALESAAKIMEGDNNPLYGLVPSWRWTDEEVRALETPDPAPAPELGEGDSPGFFADHDGYGGPAIWYGIGQGHKGSTLVLHRYMLHRPNWPLWPLVMATLLAGSVREGDSPAPPKTWPGDVMEQQYGKLPFAVRGAAWRALASVVRMHQEVGFMPTAEYIHGIPEMLDPDRSIGRDSTAPPTPAVDAANLGWALQRAWDEWVADTGHIPDGFQIHGPATSRLSANFQAATFVHHAADWYAQADRELRPAGSVVPTDTPEEPRKLATSSMQRIPREETVSLVDGDENKIQDAVDRLPLLFPPNLAKCVQTAFQQAEHVGLADDEQVLATADEILAMALPGSPERKEDQA